MPPFSNPILDEINNLSPMAQAALKQAHGQLAAQSQAPQQPTQGQDQQAQPGIISGPRHVPSLTAPDIAAPQQQTPQLPGDLMKPPGMPVAGISGPDPKAQLAGDTQHLNDLRSQGSGISQIHSPWARIPLQIADAVGGGLFPGIEKGIPGTEAHHGMLVHQQENAVQGDQTQIADAAKNDETQAQTRNFEAMPAMHEAQSALALSREKEKEAQDEATRTHWKDQADTSLREHGYKHDETGKVVPLEYSEMSEQQQAVHDLKSSQGELADANAALAKAKKENIPATMQLAQARIQNASRNSEIAMQRLLNADRTYNMRAYGTDTQGNALPGAILGDDGKPTGTAFQANVRPTGQERNKGDLASSAHEQLGDIADIMTKRPDIFGPANGRTTDFKVWMGSQDEDAQRFRAARTIAADHLAGVFGGRSETVLKSLDDAVGQFKDNPEAAIAGVRQLDKANNRFMVKGTPKTAGSDAAKPPATPPPSSSDMVRVQIPGQPAGQIHASQKDAFLKKYPTAKVL